MPRDWQPDEGYFTVDRIEHHKYDCIAFITWADSDSQKRYSIMKKSSNKKDYGAAIERKNYIDDRIVKD